MLQRLDSKAWSRIVRVLGVILCILLLALCLLEIIAGLSVACTQSC